MYNIIIESNKHAWNEAFEYHKKARSNRLHKSFADPNFIFFDERDKKFSLMDRIDSLYLQGKKVAHMQTNNVFYTNCAFSFTLNI